MIFGPLPKAQQHGRGAFKSTFAQAVAGNVAIAIPLIFQLERIDHISAAMELRRFGKHKQRTWLKAKPIQAKIFGDCCRLLDRGARIVLDGT